ncbi:hypothetical protein ABIF64_000099 [Bradyrhizobium japonicum]|uniref:Uncharacterized protein n=1 Tax=Bradyrhizobium japonicum TaxID=375 RepID=A0ABV2RLP3_BRAJP
MAWIRIFISKLQSSLLARLRPSWLSGIRGNGWPTDRIGDEAEAYKAFVAALAARRHTFVVIDAVENLLWKSGADVPWLAEALVAIEHGA